jgi:mannose-6-phosphate isomerase-like protein (cupin superfamily)
MATSGQVLSRNGQTQMQPFEQAPRPMVGYANDYLSGHETGLHRHPRAQLLFAIAGVMRIVTKAASFTVPPGTGLWVPASTLHGVRMDGVVCMRALFLRADAAASGPSVTTVIAVSPLLR